MKHWDVQHVLVGLVNSPQDKMRNISEGYSVPGQQEINYKPLKTP